MKITINVTERELTAINMVIDTAQEVTAEWEYQNQCKSNYSKDLELSEKLAQKIYNAIQKAKAVK